MPTLVRQTCPAATGEQVPFALPPAAVEQAWQSFAAPPPQALSQHTPSTQKFVAQSLACAQAPPTRGGFTSTTNEALPSFPRLSSAEHVTVVLPTGNRLPDPGPVQVKGRWPSTWSNALSPGYDAMAPAVVSASTLMSLTG